MSERKARALRKEARNKKYYKEAYTTHRDVVKLLKAIKKGKFGRYFGVRDISI